MAKKPNKVMVIGLDCALPHLIERHIAEGHLPTFKRLIEKGVIADNCLTNYPTVTPPNWATIATGALAGTHGVTDFHVHVDGEELDNLNCVAAFSTARLKAETIWEALDKAGKKTIVLNYPGSWPSKLENGIVLGGKGLTLAEHRDGNWGLESQVALSTVQLVTTGLYPDAIKAEFKPAEGWKNVDQMGDDPLACSFELTFPRAIEPLEKTVWHILVRELGEDGYDTVTLSPTRDMKDAFFSVGLGQWSENAVTSLKTAKGLEKQVRFNAKLLELSDDAEDFTLYIGDLANFDEDVCDPPEMVKYVQQAGGAVSHGGGMKGWPAGWFGLDTYVEINQQHDVFLGDVAAGLLTNEQWDLFYMHSHPPDWAYHAFMSLMDPATEPDEEKRQAAWDAHLKIYQSQDAMLEKIISAADKDTMVVLVSDHGAVADGPMFNPYEALVPAGLCAAPERAVKAESTGYAAKVLKHAAMRPDPAKSKAIPQRSLYVYLNLKGRDPGGIVDPADYEKVQREVIDCLLTYVDPATGKRPVALALSRQDARIMGLYGEHVGDVVYALYPEFGSQHGQQLPTAEWGIGSLKGLMVFHGPGLKKGHREQRTIWLTDLVPTICYLMDWPVPETCEGAVAYQVFKDPNFKTKELSKLEEGLKRMETALQRSEREPWDKHDCA